MRTIPITQELKDKAKILSEKVAENLKKTPNYTGLSVAHRFYGGYLGELIFDQLLKQENKKYIYKIITNGESQKSEFILFTEMGERKIDIKTACKSYHYKIMFPKAQKDIHNTDIYVGVKLNEDIGEIHGYCFFDNFNLSENGFDDSAIPTYYKSLSELFDIDNLLRKTYGG